MRAQLLGLALVSSGCMTSTYQSARPAASEVKTEHGEFYLWGLVGEKPVDFRQLCPDGVAHFREMFSSTNVVMQVITCGIYAPTTIEVQCASGAGYQLTPQSAHLIRVEPVGGGRP